MLLPCSKSVCRCSAALRVRHAAYLIQTPLPFYPNSAGKTTTDASGSSRVAHAYHTNTMECHVNELANESHAISHLISDELCIGGRTPLRSCPYHIPFSFQEGNAINLSLSALGMSAVCFCICIPILQIPGLHQRLCHGHKIVCVICQAVLSPAFLCKSGSNSGNELHGDPSTCLLNPNC